MQFTHLLFLFYNSWRPSPQNIMCCHEPNVMENLSWMFFSVGLQPSWKFISMTVGVKGLVQKYGTHAQNEELYYFLRSDISFVFFWIGTTYYRNYLTETHGWIWGTCLAMTCVASFIEVNYVASSICLWYFLMDKIAFHGITFMIPWIPAVWTSWISDIHCCFEHSWCFLIGRDKR